MNTANSDAKIKKVRAFPIAAQLTIGTGVTNGQILKLTPTGFLVEAQIPGLKTGEKFQIGFELPVFHHEITGACVVVKIYTTVESHVIEGHFQSILPGDEQKIMKFLASIPKVAPT